MATISYASRDNAGDPLSMGDWTGTWSYGYDDNNRLTSATAPNPVPDQPAGGIYGYDWVGNRLNPPTGTNHMVYNAADQLISWPGMHTYTYNGDGSLYQVKDSAGTNVLRSYTYTNDGLLNAATYNGRTLTNTWDAGKNRVSFTAGGNTHTFVYDTTAGIPAVIQEDGVYYVREPDGSLITRISGSDTSYYHFDALGSARLLTNASGSVTDKYSYDAYGSLISHDELSEHVDQPYQYVGQLGYYMHYQEPEFGLLQLGVRFYDSLVGRFTQRDPIREKNNHYSYVSNRVLNTTDPSGKFESPFECASKAREEGGNIHKYDDKLAHCFVHCRASRCFGFCGQGLLLLYSTYLEFGPHGNSDWWDERANVLGLYVALTNESCREGCERRIKEGRKHGKYPKG